MTRTEGDGPCASNPKIAKTIDGKFVKNRAAASLADARFRPQTTRDKTKAHPRKRKHKKDQDVE